MPPTESSLLVIALYSSSITSATWSKACRNSAVLRCHGDRATRDGGGGGSRNVSAHATC